MFTQFHTLHALHTPALSVLWHAAWHGVHRAATASIEAWTARRRHRERRRAERQLMALDDRTLHDLGLSRSDLLSLAHDPADATRVRSA